MLEFSNANWMKTRVQSYTGRHGVAEPRSFDLSNQRLDVLEIIGRWSKSEQHYFKVRAKGGKFYVLRHGDVGDGWEVTLTA